MTGKDALPGDVIPIDVSEPALGPDKKMPPHVTGYITAVLYVANHIRARAARGDVTTDQLVEIFGKNVRRVLDPDLQDH